MIEDKSNSLFDFNETIKLPAEKLKETTVFDNKAGSSPSVHEFSFFQDNSSGEKKESAKKSPN